MDKNRLQKLCADRSITISELEKSLKMSNGSLRKDGDIKSDRLMALADYFGVTMEYLMGKDSADSSDLDTEEIELLKCWRNADDDLKKMIMRLIALTKVEGDN